MAETREAQQVLKAISGGMEISKFTPNDDEAFFNYLGEWKVMIGDRRKTSSKGDTMELMLIKSMIKDLYPNITLPEIKLAVKLSMARELNMPPDLYGNQSFSVNYCTGVIKSYILYKKEHLAPVLEKWHSTPPTKPEKVWTAEDKLADMKEHFIDVYNKYIEHGIIQDPLNICYRFLYRTKRFNLNTKQVEEARKYGQEQAGKFLAKEDGSVQEAVAKMKSNTRQGDTIDIKKLQDLYSRNYCVEQLFKKFTKIGKLTDTFKVEEFTDKDQKKIQS